MVIAGLPFLDIDWSIKSRVLEGAINILDFGTNILQVFDKFFSLDPNYKKSEILNKVDKFF